MLRIGLPPGWEVITIESIGVVLRAPGGGALAITHRLVAPPTTAQSEFRQYYNRLMETSEYLIECAGPETIVLDGIEGIAYVYCHSRTALADPSSLMADLMWVSVNDDGSEVRTLFISTELVNLDPFLAEAIPVAHTAQWFYR